MLQGNAESKSQLIEQARSGAGAVLQAVERLPCIQGSIPQHPIYMVIIG